MLKASAPFQFETASYLVRIGNQRADTLVDLDEGLADCSDASIFYHTFQSLARHHFLTEGFSNDFAQWALASCNRPVLAERLASVDIRDYVQLADLRRDLRRIVGDYCGRNEQEASRRAFEPFHFCETVEEQVPLGREAWTLDEFARELKDLPHASLQFHFITSRLRLNLRSNDFSQWFLKQLSLPNLARRVDQIDMYTHTLDGVRDAVLALIEREAGR